MLTPKLEQKSAKPANSWAMVQRSMTKLAKLVLLYFGLSVVRLRKTWKTHLHVCRDVNMLSGLSQDMSGQALTKILQLQTKS